jgi:hypothetical protein
MSKWFQIDERVQQVSGTVSMIFLGLTQGGLLIAIFYQRYILSRPDIFYNDLAIILGSSTIGYWITNLFLGGILPKVSFRCLVGAYLGFSLTIFLPYIIIRGLPGQGSWGTLLLVSFGAPAVLFSGYVIAAVLGNRRLNRMVDS